MNIYSFVVRYLNNTSANNNNVSKWGLKNFAKCDICDGNQTLGHVVGGCKTALDQKRYNWRHDSILAVLLNVIKTAKKHKNTMRHCRLYEPISNYRRRKSSWRVVTQNESTIFVIELTVGFETNIDLNTKRKANKYKEILKSLEKKFEKVNFVNLSMGVLGIVGAHSSVTNKLKVLGFQQQEIANFCCCIRGKYYVFCTKNKAWSQSSLLSWWRHHDTIPPCQQDSSNLKNISENSCRI